ncbi:unnamed protein product [Rotaria sp. Silwood2]|nr:unnamed protein product [Rotaria sp. Silwood2]CAF3056114.1 unnamed protein product [Rotaria sp. Silwood2]CAF4386190.1 unnamed protein product [Rotaria sp. Silwood2]CAF4458397.1 unnamed protein product [Rotaria sp. Silwood2]
MASTSVLRKLKPSQVIEMTKAFMEFDGNDNGFITAEEMKGCLRQSNISYKDAEVNEVISNMDTNQDGTVSYEEYMKFMARMCPAGSNQSQPGKSSKSNQSLKKN